MQICPICVIHGYDLIIKKKNKIGILDKFNWRAPKFLVRPTLGLSYSTAELWGTRGMLKLQDGTRKSDKL